MALTIRTVPSLPGLRVSLDGAELATDSAGQATFVEDRNADPHTLTLDDTRIDLGGQRFTFSRWVGQRDQDQAFTPTLQGSFMRASSTVTAAFTAEIQVTPRFVDQHGQSVDPARVSSATARSDSGAIVTIAPIGATWLQGTRVEVHSDAPPEPRQVTYTWQTVVISGSNVLDSGRQSFRPAEAAEITAQGQFDDLKIAGYDALLGHGAGEQAVITFPDGQQQTAPLDTQHAAVFGHLPRGTYQVQVKAGSALVATQQIRLSRNSTVSVPVLSLLDIGILLGSIAAAGMGLVLVGRRNVRRRVLAPFRAARPIKAGAP